MIILAVDKQAEIFIFSLLIGAGCGFFYDIIKTIRLIIPHGKLLRAFEDALYWISCAVLLFMLMLKNNSGEIRVFSILAFYGAMIIYMLTISKLFMAVSEKVVFVIKTVVKLFLEIIMTPFKILWFIFKRPVLYVGTGVKKRKNSLLILFKKYVKIYGITIRERLKLMLK